MYKNIPLDLTLCTF